jgi:hypothetical protein
MGFVYAERRRCSRLNSAITMRYRPLELGTSENLRHFFAALRMLCTSICLDFRIEILPNRIEISRCERRIFIRREAEKHQVQYRWWYRCAGGGTGTYFSLSRPPPALSPLPLGRRRQQEFELCYSDDKKKIV